MYTSELHGTFTTTPILLTVMDLFYTFLGTRRRQKGNISASWTFNLVTTIMTFARSYIWQAILYVYFRTPRHIHDNAKRKSWNREGGGGLCSSTATFRLISQERVFIPHAGGDVMGNINIIPWPEKTRLYWSVINICKPCRVNKVVSEQNFLLFRLSF